MGGTPALVSFAILWSYILLAEETVAFFFGLGMQSSLALDSMYLVEPVASNCLQRSCDLEYRLQAFLRGWIYLSLTILNHIAQASEPVVCADLEIDAKEVQIWDEGNDLLLSDHCMYHEFHQALQGYAVAQEESRIHQDTGRTLQSKVSLHP